MDHFLSENVGMTLLKVFFLLGPKFTKFFVEVSLMFSFECIVSKTGLSYFFCSDAHPKPKHDVMGPFFFGGGFCFFLFWVLVCLVCLVLISIVFFLFWFWFGGPSCVNFVCFFSMFWFTFFVSLMSLSL